MSKKQLLSEGEIRRFMKYANLGPLSENFLSEMGSYTEGMEDDEMGDMGGDEMGGDMPPEEPAPESDVTVGDAQLMGMIRDTVLDAVKAALIKVGAGGEEGGEGMDVVMGDEEDTEGDEEETEDEEGELEEAYVVSEVARRVMARLSESRKPAPRSHAQKVDEVTDRIVARLTEGRNPAPARRSRAAVINEVTDRIMNRILKSK